MYLSSAIKIRDYFKGKADNLYISVVRENGVGWCVRVVDLNTKCIAFWHKCNHEIFKSISGCFRCGEV